MANEPRVVQRLERIKINANKYMALIEANPDDERIPQWNTRLQDMLRGIVVLEHEAAAVELKAKQAENPGGVHIEVPLAQFTLKQNVPSVAEEA